MISDGSQDDIKDKDKCPNCGYCIMNYVRMIEIKATFRICPVCIYIFCISNNKLYNEGIPKERLVLR